MRTKAIATAILLLFSHLLAESQESVYYQALKAEEAGEVSKSIELFERAANIDGPYTVEIKEILEEYYQALGMDKPSLKYRLRGDISVHGIHYEETGGYEDIKDNGAETFFGTSFFADYSVGSLIHSLGLNFSGNAFLGDTISPLDSAQWTVSPGVEYDLLGESFLICAGIDFKINEKEWYPVLFGWVEKNFLRMDRNRFGVALSVSKEWDHQFVASLFASWRRFNTRGFNASLLVGPKVTADNIFDYDAWLQAYQASFYREPPQEPWERDSSEFGGWGMEPPPDEQDMENIADSTWDENYYPKYNVKWVGPYLRGKFSYKFRYNITAELNMNLFYGLVVDGPNSDYEKMNKFTGLWGPTFYWSPNIMTFYAGVENVFRRYFDIPDTYKNVLSDSMSLWEAKIGMKLDW